MPNTTVKWHDQSAPSNSTQTAIDNSPLFLAFSSMDRGPEDLRVVSGTEFFTLYGSKMNFARHGQPALQAANIINGGGRLLFKRLVANDATLANAVAVATVNKTITATKAAEGDVNGKTIDEILGKEPVIVDYVEQLDIVSTVGVGDNTTSLAVSPEKEAGNVYLYKVTDSEAALVLGTDVSDWDEWDGETDLQLADGTKIMVVEAVPVDGEVVKYEAQKAGVITVVSKIPHPNTTSIDPTNSLPALYITSTEGSEVGKTRLVVSPSMGSDSNVYLYKQGIEFLDPEITYDPTDAAWDWIEWDGTSELELADGTDITVIEGKITEADPEDPESTATFKANKGAAIAVCTKLEPDERSSESVSLIIPTEALYVVTSQVNTLKWEIKYVSNCKYPEEVNAAAAQMGGKNDPKITENPDDEGGVIIVDSKSYPLIVASDNGRCDSTKSFRFQTDLSTSKDHGNMYYDVYCLDGTTLIENKIATLNPNAVYNNVRYGLNAETSNQIIYHSPDGVYDEYVNDLSVLLGKSVEELRSYDLIFATTNRAAAIANFTLADDSADLAAETGIPLKGGSNGAFGDVPFGTTAWTNAAIDLLNGNYDNIIYDVDVYKIVAAFDANYPKPVKEALSKLVTFREDFFYFRDYGTDVSSFSSIVEYYNSFDNLDGEMKNSYIGDYYTTYQIYDPETKIRERVTMMYDFARVAVSRLANAAHLPLAGYANAMILSSAIEGTLNFTPRKTPSIDQKSLLKDMRLNYAIFEEGNLIVQSLFTSQEEYTQLSYSNNVIAIQETVRSIRTTCPKQRFTFATGSDFTSYANAVNSVLMRFKSNFSILRFDYQQDKLKASQKIFYATIVYAFHNWAEEEQFDLFAINNDEE